MKSLNVRKIAALAAGAAMLAGSVVAAEISYGNVPIINDNGVPQVKIVVGEKAAASDGVAAANLAALIGNLAYKTQSITATIEGKATCSVSGGAQGTCPVTNKKVTLNVTIPGTVTGAYGISTYISDYIDAKVKNREVSTPDDQDADTPFSMISNPYATLEVTGSNFPPLATVTVTDPYAGKSYTQQQSIFVKAKTVYDTNLKAVVGTYPAVGYVIKFTQDQYGLPVCTEKSDGNWANCASTDRTDRHRVRIKFLGEDWIISEMSPPTTALASSTANVTGGYIKLAKESSYGIVHIGENLTVGAYTVKLADITVPVYQGGGDASIQIFDANGNLLKEDKVAEGATYTWNAPDGSKVRIKVYKTNPGYTLQAKWAEMAIYSQEKTLESGKKLDDDNEDWQVTLIWKNKDYTGTGSDTSPDTLREIWLVNEAPANSLIRLQKGQSFNIVAKPTVWHLQYDGLDLGDADYDNLSFNIVTGVSMTTKHSSGACNVSQGTSLTLLSVQSSLNEAFEIGGNKVSQFYVDLSKMQVNSSGNLHSAQVYYKLSGESCWSAYNVTTSVTPSPFDITGGVSYDVGDEKKLTLGFHSVASGALNVTLEEYAGKVGSSDAYDYLRAIVAGSGSSWQFVSTDKVNYTDVGAHDVNLDGEQEEGFITERGTKFWGVESSSLQYKVAKKVAEAKYYLKSAGQAVGTSQLVTMGEGETQSFAGGVSIGVTNIQCDVGTCSVGGASGACTVDQSALKAVPSTSKAVVITPVSSLVALDSQIVDRGAAMILVGGPIVNKLTQEAVATSAIDFKAEGQVVKVIGNKIVVAGYDAAGTMAAVEKLMRELEAQRP